MALKNKTHDVEKASIAQRAQQETARAASEHPRPVNAAIALQRAANSPPSALRPADILVLQRTVGNRAVERMFSNRSQARPPQPSTPANAVQLKAEEEEPLQAKSETDRMRENRTGLPDGLKSGIESLSGISLDGVNVHYNSSQPAQLNALAYTRGGDIYVAPGQERHLPHEAWHVVQQKQGRVRPTMQLKEGVSVNDEEGLEREADVMGAKALTHAGSSSSVSVTQKTDGLSVGNSSETPVQRLPGFEVELQIPTFGPTPGHLQMKEDGRRRVFPNPATGHPLVTRRSSVAPQGPGPVAVQRSLAPGGALTFTHHARTIQLKGDVIQAEGFWDYSGYIYDIISAATIIATISGAIGSVASAAGLGWMLPVIIQVVGTAVQEILRVEAEEAGSNLISPKGRKEKYLEILSGMVNAMTGVIGILAGNDEVTAGRAVTGVVSIIMITFEVLRINFIDRETIWGLVCSKIPACQNLHDKIKAYGNRNPEEGSPVI